MNGYLQVVLTSTKPSELCVNGMSFSRRSSKWANSALVVTVSAEDFSSLNFQGPLAGVDFQVLFDYLVQLPGFMIVRRLLVNCLNAGTSQL